ncbi:hypothetical protein LTR78_003385 [Recurvomyces mirabilis]|uniref:Linoleate diol synthase n=1 Tax=Recurvomyces mirabilis TaxID=574656 RepID=A0AAE0WRJ7_9PEZI|nr:hypothetical protein LTR78_003385 [Recurvomyces mirabilis]KAK5154579.1 hypothetical protein LTS14_006717 [Recurvomyces mirabilis]
MPGQLKSLLGSIRRKPSTAPDQKTDREANGTAERKTSILHDVLHNGKDARMLAEALPTLASGEPLNDKELLLEHGVDMLQRLPLNSGLSSFVSDKFIGMLYQDLPHPSTTIAGPTARYRRHDGGNNNIWNPEMGKAGTPYARNVPPMKAKGPNLPDPELVWEHLLKRPEGTFKEHPSGLNRLFFSFATIVIHECFQTNRPNQWINDTSSYVDLSTLYGNTEKDHPKVRTYTNGLLFPDSIASERIMLMPPGVVALLILFSRNHNTIAKNLLSINEEGKYKEWSSMSEKDQTWQDEDIFQLSRNINVGFFATVVLKDYVSAILNTPRNNSTWSLDLGKEIKSVGNRLERGTGNVVSVEFAVLYHWHAALSAADADWMERLVRASNPELKSLDDMTAEMFYKMVMKAGHELAAIPAKDWVFNNLKRGENGHFEDADLAELIKDCIEEPAHAFGAHGTPASLKVVDLMGQLQAREVFNVCTLNEFRAYLNLKPYANFEDWCEDKDTARAAELLYSHVDNLELYPGLMAECTKPAMPGSGVCPGHTTGRGILDDAVALVRGDRFLSYDFNSSTLTNWGMSKVQQIPEGAYGGMLPKLMFNAMPTSFTGTSSYALLPFYTPKAAQGILKGNKVIEHYDVRRPGKDVTLPTLRSVAGCQIVLADGGNFRATLTEHKTLQSIFFEENFSSHVAGFFSISAAKQIKQSSLRYAGTKRAINIVRDVTNITPVLWLAERFAIPLKTATTPRGILTVPELFEIYHDIAMYQTFNVVPEDEWKLRAAAQTGSAKLKQILELHAKTQGGGIKEMLADRYEKGSAYEVKPDADRLYHALNKAKVPISDLVDECISFSASIAHTITQQSALLIDLFMEPKHAEHKARLVQLAQRHDEAATTELQAYVLEGMRHTGFGMGVTRLATRDSTIQDGSYGAVSVRAGQKVLAAVSTAVMDSTSFASPDSFNPDRSPELYTTLLGPTLSKVAAPAIAGILKEVFRLEGIRRSPSLPGSNPGHLTVVEKEFAGIKMRHYLDSSARESQYPTSMMLQYEEPTPYTNGHGNGHANGVVTNGNGKVANGVNSMY